MYTPAYSTILSMIAAPLLHTFRSGSQSGVFYCYD